MRGWPDSVRIVQDSIFGADGIWHIEPAIVADDNKNVALVFIRSSEGEFPSLYYTGRLGTDPPNTLRPSAALKVGTGTAGWPETNPRGYVDYIGAALDPTDNSFWLFGKYGRAGAAGTWVGNVALPAGVAESGGESP